MPAKMARSAPRPPFGLPEVTVAVRTSLLSCRKAGKTPIFTPVRESSGESRLLCGGQRRHRRAHDRACPRGGEGGHPFQHDPPGTDQNRDPRARPDRADYAAAADGQARRAAGNRRNDPVPIVGHGVIHQRRHLECLGGALARRSCLRLVPCVRRLAAYDRRRNPSTQQTKSIEGVKLWSRQYAFTSTAVPKLWFLRTFKLRRPARARSRSSSMLAASIASTAISAWACTRRRSVCRSSPVMRAPAR